MRCRCRSKKLYCFDGCISVVLGDLYACPAFQQMNLIDATAHEIVHVLVGAMSIAVAL